MIPCDLTVPQNDVESVDFSITIHDIGMVHDLTTEQSEMDNQMLLSLIAERLCYNLENQEFKILLSKIHIVPSISTLYNDSERCWWKHG